ncbi:acyltransferase [Cognaticolwellia mytili]|uniref:acyltransferase n=1 Tax=Cognaticolwellia mytili TaxID=1888913 RepID=UPI000A16D32A|nr:acyltransferase [Cognaticolwellia mytili]
MTIYSNDELRQLGFAAVGSNVCISRKASFYGASRISIGNNVRIDDFCVLSAGEGGITIGNYIHIAVYSSLIGAANISLGDYCNISSRVAIYSSSDDYSGNYMTNPMVDSAYTNVLSKPVVIKEHVIIGANSVVLPSVTIGLGVAVGALSLVSHSLAEWGIYAGQPAKFIKQRNRQLLTLATSFEEKHKNPLDRL